MNEKEAKNSSPFIVQHQLEAIGDELSDHIHKISSKRDSYITFLKTYKKNELDYQQRVRTLNTYEKNLENARDTLEENRILQNRDFENLNKRCDKAIAQCIRQLNLLDHEIAENKNKFYSIDEEFREFDKKIKNTIFDINDLSHSHSSLLEQIDESNDSFRSSDLNNSQRELDNLSSTVKESTYDISICKNNIDNLNRSINQKKSTISSLNQRINQLKDQITESISPLSLQNDFETISIPHFDKSQLITLENQKATVSSSITSLIGRYRHISQELKLIQEQISKQLKKTKFLQSENRSSSERASNIRPYASKATNLSSERCIQDVNRACGSLLDLILVKRDIYKAKLELARETKSLEQKKNYIKNFKDDTIPYLDAYNRLFESRQEESKLQSRLSEILIPPLFGVEISDSTFFPDSTYKSLSNDIDNCRASIRVLKEQIRELQESNDSKLRQIRRVSPETAHTFDFGRLSFQVDEYSRRVEVAKHDISRLRSSISLKTARHRFETLISSLNYIHALKETSFDATNLSQYSETVSILIESLTITR